MKSQEEDKNLIVVPPGKYLLADKNEFVRLSASRTGLLISDLNEKKQKSFYKLVLLDDRMILI